MSGTPFPAKARQVGAPHLAFCASFRPILYHFFHDCQGGLLFLFTFFIYFEKLRQFFAPVRLCGAQSDDPEYHAAERARQRSVQKNRTCDREYLGADAKDQTLGACVDGWGGDSVGKSRDGNQCACPGIFGNAVKDAQPGQHGGDQHQRYGRQCAAVLAAHAADPGVEVAE